MCSIWPLIMRSHAKTPWRGRDAAAGVGMRRICGVVRRSATGDACHDSSARQRHRRNCSWHSWRLACCRTGMAGVSLASARRDDIRRRWRNIACVCRGGNQEGTKTAALGRIAVENGARHCCCWQYLGINIWTSIWRCFSGGLLFRMNSDAGWAEDNISTASGRQLSAKHASNENSCSVTNSLLYGISAGQQAGNGR